MSETQEIKQKNSWHWRGLTSFFVTIGFIVMALTGLVLIIVPQGRVAYWTIWSLLGLTKTQWGNIHLLSSLIFLVSGGFHLYFNWKPLIKYLFKRKVPGFYLKKELLLALTISTLFIIGAIAPFPPFRSALDLADWVKEAWIVSPEYEPPFGHAEEVSLRVFCKRMGIPLDQAKELLTKEGFGAVDVAASLEAIAASRNLAPMELYVLLKPLEPTQQLNLLEMNATEVEEHFAGKGLGRKKIFDLCRQIGLDSNIAVQRLENKGAEIKTEDTLKRIAERMDKKPMDILKIMLNLD